MNAPLPVAENQPVNPSQLQHLFVAAILEAIPWDYAWKRNVLTPGDRGTNGLMALMFA
jgi:hypothetical protein